VEGLGWSEPAAIYFTGGNRGSRAVSLRPVGGEVNRLQFNLRKETKATEPVSLE
jgi:hypothetical protein